MSFLDFSIFFPGLVCLQWGFIGRRSHTLCPEFFIVWGSGAIRRPNWGDLGLLPILHFSRRSVPKLGQFRFDTAYPSFGADSSFANCRDFGLAHDFGLPHIVCNTVRRWSIHHPEVGLFSIVWGRFYIVCHWSIVLCRFMVPKLCVGADSPSFAAGSSFGNWGDFGLAFQSFSRIWTYYHFCFLWLLNTYMILSTCPF